MSVYEALEKCVNDAEALYVAVERINGPAPVVVGTPLDTRRRDLNGALVPSYHVLTPKPYDRCPSMEAVNVRYMRGYGEYGSCPACGGQRRVKLVAGVWMIGTHRTKKGAA